MERATMTEAEGRTQMALSRSLFYEDEALLQEKRNAALDMALNARLMVNQADKALKNGTAAEFDKEILQFFKMLLLPPDERKFIFEGDAPAHEELLLWREIMDSAGNVRPPTKEDFAMAGDDSCTSVRRLSVLVVIMNFFTIVERYSVGRYHEGMI